MSFHGPLILVVIVTKRFQAAAIFSVSLVGRFALRRFRAFPVLEDRIT